MTCFVARFSHDGTEHEYPFEAPEKSLVEPTWSGFQSICRDILYKKKIESGPEDDHHISFHISRVTAENGAMAERFAAKLKVSIPCRDYTFEEYQKRLDTILADLPQEFRQFVNERSYEDGHSSGYRTVLNIARDMTSDLVKCVNQYRKNLQL